MVVCLASDVLIKRAAVTNVEPHVRIRFLQFDDLIAEHVVGTVAAAEEKINLPLVLDVGQVAGDRQHGCDANAA
jgi:hypothetical protein